MKISDNLKKYLYFSPFLLVYAIITILLSKDTLVGDENRYFYFASNLTKGFYSLPMPDADFTNGPGYPIIFALFLFFKCSFIFIRLLNAVMLYLSVIFIYSAVLKYAKPKFSILLAVIFGLYYPFYQYLPLLLSEITTIFLLCLLIYLLVTREKGASFFKSTLLPSFVLAFLVLTKVVFSYVVIFIILLFLVLYIIEKAKPIRDLIIMMSLAIALCIPYLIYTYSITGKIFYWGGSMDTLYWMSSPHENDLGDWQPDDLRGRPDLEKNHKAFFDSIQHFNSLEKDDAFRAKTIQNLTNHPKNYLKNVYANVGRMFFNYPFSSDRHEKLWHYDLLYMYINMFFATALLVLLFSALFYFFRLDIELRFFILLISVYLAVSALASAEKRMFFPVIPLVIIWIAHYSRLFKITTIKYIKR